MTSVTKHPALLLLPLLILAGSAGAELTTDEARLLAEQSSGDDLRDAKVAVRDLSNVVLIEFRTGDHLSGCRYTVNATDAYYSGWQLVGAEVAYGGDGETTEAEAIAAARAEARLLLGQQEDTLTWTGRADPHGGFEVRGVSPPAGDPPRPGVGPSVRAHVTPTGELVSYHQRVLTPEQSIPAEVRVTSEEAAEIAREDCRLKEAELIEPPHLDQFRGLPRWTVRLTTPGGADEPDASEGGMAEYVYLISAASGEILHVAEAAVDIDLDLLKPPPADGSAGSWLTAAAIVPAVLIAGLVAGVVLARRRAYH